MKREGNGKGGKGRGRKGAKGREGKVKGFAGSMSNCFLRGCICFIVTRNMSQEMRKRQPGELDVSGCV